MRSTEFKISTTTTRGGGGGGESMSQPTLPHSCSLFSLLYLSGNPTIGYWASWVGSLFLWFFLPPSPPSVLLSGRFNYVSYISTDSLISAITCFTTNSSFLYLSLPYGTLEVIQILILLRRQRRWLSPPRRRGAHRACFFPQIPLTLHVLRICFLLHYGLSSHDW